MFSCSHSNCLIPLPDVVNLFYFKLLILLEQSKFKTPRVYRGRLHFTRISLFSSFCAYARFFGTRFLSINLIKFDLTVINIFLLNIEFSIGWRKLIQICYSNFKISPTKHARILHLFFYAFLHLFNLHVTIVKIVELSRCHECLSPPPVLRKCPPILFP